MARRPRRDDPDRDRSEEDGGNYEPPSRRTANLTIFMLVGAGILLIAYFILELRMDDLGGATMTIIAAIVLLLIARTALWR